MKKDFRWISTSIPTDGRYDDVFFINKDVGWVVGGASLVRKTTDGGKTWSSPTRLPGYPRCIGMRDEQVGWIGLISGDPPLYHTSDGGLTWSPVRNLPTEKCSQLNSDAPPAVCGLQVFGQDLVFATGTNFPWQPARFLKSENGGQTWTSRNMEDHATILVDVWFTSETQGWLVGARKTRPYSLRDDVIPVVLKTEDGGDTWEDKLNDTINPPLGEWGWKIQFVDDDFIVVACENFKAGGILISENAGENWRRLEIRNHEGAMINANLEGIGFLDRNTGWVGGWGDQAISSGRSSETRDGGKTWTDVTTTWPKPLEPIRRCPADQDKGQYINRFRFVDGVGYAAGNSVYKYTDEPRKDFGPIAATTRQLVACDGVLVYDGGEVDIPVLIDAGTKALSVELFDRFGGKIRTLAKEENPADGLRRFTWDLLSDDGNSPAIGQFIIKVRADSDTECRLMFHKDTPVEDEKKNYVPYMLEGA